MAKINILDKIYTAGPLILLYYLSISEVDANLENLLDIFSKLLVWVSLFIEITLEFRETFKKNVVLTASTKLDTKNSSNFSLNMNTCLMSVLFCFTVN